MTAKESREMIFGREEKSLPVLEIVSAVVGLCLVAAMIFIVIEVSNNQVEPKSYKSVTIQSGDTLWAIADECGTTSVDIRRVVHIINDKNNISNSIRPGMVLQVPVFE